MKTFMGMIIPDKLRFSDKLRIGSSVSNNRQLRVLITGAGRGIGRAIVNELKVSPLKHKIAVTARTESELQDSIKGASGETLVIAADLLDSKSPSQIIEKVVEKFGGLDFLVLNAGDGISATIESTDDELWNRTMELNATAPFRFIRSVAPIMREQGGGKIVIVASEAGLHGAANVAAYSASKHAIVGLMRSAAAELSRDKIQVNAVCPIFVDTPMMQRSVEAAAARTGKSVDEVRTTLASRQPGGRVLTPEEVASAVVSYLSVDTSGEAKYLDGSNTNGASR
jgi:NAD(P)-dependent dehydrogenase (short-subunit alcohol dehydrogenase family)